MRIHGAGPADAATDLRAAAWLGHVGEFMIYEQWPGPVGLPRSKDGWNMSFRIINARIAYTLPSQYEYSTVPTVWLLLSEVSNTCLGLVVWGLGVYEQQRLGAEGLNRGLRVAPIKP